MCRNDPSPCHRCVTFDHYASYHIMGARSLELILLQLAIQGFAADTKDSRSL